MSKQSSIENQNEKAIYKLRVDCGNLKKLADRIYKFLDAYAGVRPDWDGQDPDDKFTSPDASSMKCCADMLSKGLKPGRFRVTGVVADINLICQKRVGKSMIFWLLKFI